MKRISKKQLWAMADKNPLVFDMIRDYYLMELFGLSNNESPNEKAERLKKMELLKTELDNLREESKA
jgi:hypothetical protein